MSLVVVMALAALSGCGKNKGAPGGGDEDQSSAGSGAPLNIQPGADLKVAVVWEKGPAVGTDNVFNLSVRLKPGSAVESISVTPWMTIHGHGSGNVQPVVTAVPDSVGTWRVSNVFFVMSGPWDLKIAIRSTQPDADDSEETEYRVTVPVDVPVN